MNDLTEKSIHPAPTCSINAPKAVVFGLFIAFIAIFFLLILFLPKHEGELSPNERRILAKAPDADFENIRTGGFSKQVDTWMQDHFPLRSEFVSMYSYANRYTGRNTVESVVLGSNNRLIKAPIKVNDDSIAASIDKLSNFIGKNKLNAYTFIIPTSGYMLEKSLPKLHLEYHDGVILDKIESNLTGRAEIIPVRNIFNEHGNVESLYYLTDHHITMQGSYLSYAAIARKLGLQPLAKNEFKKTSYDFYGTLYGQSCLFGTPCDTLETWIGSYDDKLTVTINCDDKRVHQGSLDLTCLKDDVVDKYGAYLYSNNGITTIVNDSVSDGTLLVLKDSFGNAIVPFLAAHYHTIIMIDTRSIYYTPLLPTPSDLCKEYGVQDFVIITGIDTIAEGNIDGLR